MRVPVALLLACLLLLAPLSGSPRARAGASAVDDAKEILDRYAKEPFEQRRRQAAIRKLGKIGGPEAAAVLLPLFDDPFVHLRDHAVSAWIDMVRGERGADTVAWLGAHALRCRQATVRIGATTALSFDRRGDALPLLRAAVEDVMKKPRGRGRDGKIEGAVALARALARLQATPEDGLLALLHHPAGSVALAAADALLEQAAEIPETEIARLLDASSPLARAGGVALAARRGAPGLVQRLAHEKDDAPKIILAEALQEAGRVEKDALAFLLSDPAWRVRAAAIGAAEHARDLQAVPLLTERLPLEDGRLALDLVRALRSLTGAEIGDDVDLWRGWWLAHAETAAAPAKARSRAAVPDVETKAAFFHLPVRSKQMAFLLDASGSMRDAVDKERPGGGTKWALARDETLRTLEALDKGARYDVFVYRYPSDFPPKAEMLRARGKLDAASRSSVKKTRKWLMRQSPGGWGAFYDALATILDTDVDTIYFLSDGRPSRGRYDRDFRLLDELARLNRFRQVVVHTVLVGRGGADRRFLEDLAARTGGHFVDASSAATPSKRR